MEPFYSTSSFTSDASLPGRPYTPPYTPIRASKRRLERSDSPASTVDSIHPDESDSPAKKAVKRVTTDNVTVEELAEGDIGYLTDIDVVYPEELEEMGSDSDSADERTTNTSDAEDTGLMRKLSRLRCGDDRELDFEQKRRQRHQEKRTGRRMFKRTHSQSVKSDVDLTDTDGLDDQDLDSSRRRLRRRVRGPQKAADGQKAFEAAHESSDAGNPRMNASHAGEGSPRPFESADVMDVDDAT